jgi:hypothetical protein
MMRTIEGKTVGAPTPYRAWEVLRGSQVIDTVFFDPDCDEDYVRRALIEHDGYPDDIVVSTQHG